MSITSYYMTKINNNRSIAANFGLLETLFVLRDILAPYKLLFFDFSLYLILLLIILALIRAKGLITSYHNFPFKVLIIYVLIHDVLIMFAMDYIPTHHFNSLLMTFINLVGIFIVFPVIDFKKYINALIVITPIVCIGIAYHAFITFRGGFVHPIPIPFLEPVSERLSEEGLRPVSFFMEPSNFATFMITPLFLSLYFKKIWYTALIVVFMIASTSTNGIVASALMIGTYVITQKSDGKNRILYICVLAIGALLLVNANFFETSRDKIIRTDLESDGRTINGPILLKEMPKEHLIFGFPASNVNDYKNTGSISGANLAELNDGTIYVSSNYLTLAKYGIIGYILFIIAFYSLYKRNNALIILLLPLFILKFSWGGCFNSSTFIWCVIMLSFTKYLEGQKNKQNYMSINNSINRKLV